MNSDAESLVTHDHRAESREPEPEQTEYGVETSNGTGSLDIESPAEPDFVEELSLDHIFEILKNERRRRVLQYLQDGEGPVSLSDLSEHIAALENGTTVDGLSSQERKRVYVGLYQCHLPKMDDMGFVKFNKDRGIIELGPAASQADRYLDLPAPRRRWPQYYLALAVAGWVSLLLATLVPTMVPGGAASIALGMTAAVTFVAGAQLFKSLDDGEDTESRTA